MIHDGGRPSIPRLIGRCQTCGTKDVVVFHVESDDRRICRPCVSREIADSVDVPMYDGSSLMAWTECHVDHRRYVAGCPLCGTGKAA